MTAEHDDWHLLDEEGIIHLAKLPKAITWCGEPYIDFFATREAGAFIMARVTNEVTCQKCLEASGTHT